MKSLHTADRIHVEFLAHEQVEEMLLFIVAYGSTVEIHRIFEEDGFHRGQASVISFMIVKTKSVLVVVNLTQVQIQSVGSIIRNFSIRT